MADRLNFSTGNEPVNLKMDFSMDVEKVEVFDEPKGYCDHPGCTQVLNELTMDLCPHSKSLENCAGFNQQQTLIDFLNNIEEHYMVNDNGTIYKTVKTGNFYSTPDFDVPKLNVSGFEGCPHIYGKIYWKGTIYEIQQKISEAYLEEGKKTGGDWTGYKVGDFTQRFLTKESLDRAFEMLKIMM